MKENTKFLWMYVAILFSFALILIVFAGFSQNSDAEQTKGLKSDITELSQKNTELRNSNDVLLKQVSDLTAENEALKAQVNSEKAIDDALLAASKSKDVGDYQKAKEILEPIDPLALTEAQFYIYNGLVK